MRSWQISIALALMSACRDSSPAAVDATSLDGGRDATPDKDAYCTASFGNAITADYGRVDGIITAVIEPGNQRCIDQDNDHVIVQVRMRNAIYRMVVNVESNSLVKEIRMRNVPHPLLGPSFAEGWHPGVTLDYVTDLGVHSTDDSWTAEPLQAAAQRIADVLIIGAPIAVYASSFGGAMASGVHLIHRNAPGLDGALVVDPTGAIPVFVLFHFENQTF